MLMFWSGDCHYVSATSVSHVIRMMIITGIMITDKLESFIIMVRTRYGYRLTHNHNVLT